MQKYILLLRGINVGGKNKVSMPQLKAHIEKAGFTNVSTYINSGNVIFESGIDDKLKLIEICTNIMTEKFSLYIPVTVVSAEEMRDALAHAPEWWDAPSETEMVHQAIFVIPPATAEQVCKAVGEAKPEYEQVAHHKDVIFWSAARATFSRTRWSKISSSAAYGKVTVRNANTAKKLAVLSGEG